MNNETNIRVGQIIWVNKGNSESCADEMRSNRPAVVINTHGDQKVTVVYLTTSKKQAHRIRYNVNVLCCGRQAVARCDKITTVDISRIDPDKSMGEVSMVELAYIKQEVKNYLQGNKNIEAAQKNNTKVADLFLQRGYIYRIAPGSGDVTGKENNGHSYGLIVNNTSYLDHEQLIKADTLIVSFGISEQEYRQASDKGKYIPVLIPEKSEYKMYYFKTDEYYEVDRSRIIYWDTENFLGHLDERQIKYLNGSIRELFTL